jgi:NAD(P)-dependent dehydrogenase (short-subunit alcohol dehydrogenase family)
MIGADIFDLTGRSVLVTGGGRGLGAAMARALAARGASIAVFDAAAPEDSDIMQSVRHLGSESFYFRGDVTDAGAVAGAIESVVSRFGGLDIMVNNAGIALNGAAEAMPLEDIQRVLDVDLLGMLRVCQAGYEALRVSSAASVINIASIAGISVLRPQKHIGYNAAKAAVVMLTKTLAVEWAHAGIRVNAIAPGYMTSPAVELLKQENPDHWNAWMAAVPVGRAGDPEELGGAAVYLASRASSYVTGSVLVVDGGYTCT